MSCKDRVRHIYPKNVYTLRETLFEKVEGFSIPVSKDNTLFNNLAIFDFESICVPSDELKATQTTTWIGKHVPISVSISSNLIDEPIFLYNKDPQKLIIDFVIKLELLAEKIKLEMRTKFQDVERVVNERMSKIFQEVNERCRNLPTENFEYEDKCIEDTEKTDMSTQFLRMQKNQLIDLKQNLERYVNTLPVFGFNSGRYDLKLIKSYLIPYLINDKEAEPMVIKKANDFISFKFGDIQFLDIMKFLGGATSLDCFLKAYKASETKGFFPYEWFDSPDKLESEELPPYEAFFSKLRNNNPLDKDFKDYQNLKSSGLDEQQALKKLQIRSVPASGWDNYKYLQEIWQKHGMTTFKDFLQWYNNKDVVPTLEAMQKMVQFYHQKEIDMLKLGCTLPNLANIFLHISTNENFYPFCESDRYLCEKIREDMTGGPSIVFTRKAVVDETFIRDSSNVCKSIVGIDASQLYPYSMCQNMPTGLYTRWEFDSDMRKFKARHNRSRNFENMVMSYYQETRPECRIESFHTSGNQKKIDCFNVVGYCNHCKTVFEAMGCYYHFCPCQETRPSLSDEDIERGNKRREMDDLRREYIREKGYKIEEMWECEWWQNFKTNEKVKNHIRSNFPYKRPLSTDSLLEKIRDGSLYGYIQCDLVVPDELKAKFSNFPPIFKNTDVGRNDIGEYMQNYAIENDLLKHPQRMLISSFKLENGSIITPLFNFYMELGLQCTKVYRFVQYLPRKCFNKFVQSVVDARREGDENPLSGVVAETMKLLGNSSYGYQIMDRSRHTITKYLNDEKTHKAINEPLFKRLNTVQKDLYKIELLKSTIEHKEPIIVGFFILQYAKLRMLELYNNFFDKFCDVNKFEELEMDTGSLYLALAEENLYDCICPEKKADWENLREKDCRDSFRADSKTNFFPRTLCSVHKKHDKREPGLFKEEFRCTEMLCLCSKTYCCYDNKSDKMKFSSKGLNKRILEESGDGPMEKYRKVLDEAINKQRI